MDDQEKYSEISIISHVALVFAVLIFSLILIAEDIILDRELWMIPVIVAMALISAIMHITRSPSEKVRTYIYTGFLMLDLFYYGVNARTNYDTTPVIIIMLVLLVMTADIRLLYICIGVGFFTMFFNLFVMQSNGFFKFDSGVIIRTLFHVLLVLLSGIVAIRMLKQQERKRRYYERRIEEVTEENIRANNFLANVSHEIRTPINAVIGLTTVSLKNVDNKEAFNNLISVKHAGHRIAEQIGDILDYTEIDMNRLSVNEESYRISSIINDIVHQTEGIRRPEIELIFDVDTQVPRTLIGDGTKVKKIIWHLISNGIKFTKQGGVYVRISSMKRSYGINLCIEVKDTGIGLSEEEIGQIFDKFYQSDAGRTRNAGGLGLGLSIVSGFIKAMGGFLAFDSKKNVGTTVKISLPQKVEDADPCMSVKKREEICLLGIFQFKQFSVPMVREYYQTLISNLVKGLGVTMHIANNSADILRLLDTYNISHILMGEYDYYEYKNEILPFSKLLDIIVFADDSFEPDPDFSVKVLRKPVYCFPIANALNESFTDVHFSEDYGRIFCPGVRALVVDDEPMNLIVANGIFKNYGMKVTCVSSGAEAIDKCLEDDFDLIFMDHMMPEMDGIEATRKIRANASKQGKEFGIIALTANAVSSAKEMFLSEGFDGFVPKPIELAELDRVLKRVLPKSMITYEEGSLRDDPEQESGAADPAGTDGSVHRPGPAEIVPLLEKAGLDISLGLEYCGNDFDFYRTLLEQYVHDYPSKSRDISAFYNDQNWSEYEIRVHGLKSTSKMIGDQTVSEMARSLETAAREGNPDLIRQDHARAMEMYSALTNGIRDALGMSGDCPEDCLPDEEPEILEFAPEGGDNT